MSVQSEITRLQNAKAAIKAAIEGKGVTVPDATMLDGMAALIESIEAGGDSKIAFTKITPAKNKLTLTFDHKLGVSPNFIIWNSNIAYNAYTRAHLFGLVLDLTDQDLNWNYCMFKWTSSTTPQNDILVTTSRGGLTASNSGYGVISYDEKAITFGSNGTNTVNFIAGKDVVVITGVIE